MKRMYLLLLPLLALLFLAACESGGNFRVINRTSYPVYVTLDDEAEFAIPAGTEHTFEVATANQHIFNPDVSVEVPVRLVGETFQIYDEGNEVFTDTTRVVIHAGKTTSVFVDPNRASFKVVNNSSQYNPGQIVQAQFRGRGRLQRYGAHSSGKIRLSACGICHKQQQLLLLCHRSDGRRGHLQLR